MGLNQSIDLGNGTRITFKLMGKDDESDDDCLPPGKLRVSTLRRQRQNLNRVVLPDCDSDCECEKCVEAPPNRKRKTLPAESELDSDDELDEESTHFGFEELGKRMNAKFPNNDPKTNITNTTTLKGLFQNHLKRKNFDLNCLRYPKIVLKSIEDRPITSQRLICSAISKAFQLYDETAPDEYLSEMRNINDQIDEDLEDKEMSLKEKEKMITKDELKEIEKTKFIISEKDNEQQKLEKYQNEIIFDLYTKMEPLRLDWAELRLAEADEKSNYINLNDKTLVLRTYKTAKTYGEKKISIPQDIILKISKYVLFRDRLNIRSEYLLINPTDKKMMSRANLSKWLGRIFGPGRGVNILRKYYVSSRVDASKVKAEEEMAKKMCHSVGVQRRNYSKKLPLPKAK